MIILRWILSALTVMLVAYLVPGIGVSNFYAALLVALFLGLLNALIRPILILLTLPITVLSLGLFVFVINALILLVVSSIVKGFEVSGFSTALAGAVILWALNWLINAFVFVRRS